MPAKFNKAPEPLHVQDKQSLVKAIASELDASGPTKYSVCYSCEDPDANSPPNIQKDNAKQISLSIIRRVNLLRPSYEWIRKSVQISSHSITNNFVCALADSQRTTTSTKLLSTCDGIISISLVRRKSSPGTVQVLVELKHKYAHLPGSDLPLLPKKGKETANTTSSSTQTNKVSKSKSKPHPPTKKVSSGSAIVKDVLRALGKRPRTPEKVKRSKHLASITRVIKNDQSLMKKLTAPTN